MGRLSRWLRAEGLQPGDLGDRQVRRFLADHGAGRRRVPTERTPRPMLGTSAAWAWCPRRRCRSRRRRWRSCSIGTAGGWSKNAGWPPGRWAGTRRPRGDSWASGRTRPAREPARRADRRGGDEVPARGVRPAWGRISEGAGGRAAVAAAVSAPARAHGLAVGCDGAAGGGVPRHDAAEDVDRRAGHGPVGQLRSRASNRASRLRHSDDAGPAESAGGGDRRSGAGRGGLAGRRDRGARQRAAATSVCRCRSTSARRWPSISELVR